MSGRPASSRVNAMPGAGARAGWTPGCGSKQLWLGWWTTLRASLYRRCPPCRLHKQLQQARCLIEGGARDLERVKEALAPIRSPAVMKPRAKDPMKTRVRTGLRELRRGV